MMKLWDTLTFKDDPDRTSKVLQALFVLVLLYVVFIADPNVQRTGWH